MAGVTKIGQHEVTEIKRDAAQVGCTKVTRAEVEELLKKMDSAPRDYEKFTIEKVGGGSEFVDFTIRRQEPGWVTVSEKVDNGYHSTYFGGRAAHFCLRKENAQRLFEFLGGALGYNCYFPETYGPSAIFTKV